PTEGLAYGEKAENFAGGSVPQLTPAAIGGDALIRNPQPLGQSAGLPKNIDWNAAARLPVAADPEPFRLDLGSQPLADHDCAILVECTVIAEASNVKLQRFRLQEPLARGIVDDEMRKVRLPRDRTDRSELRHGEAHQIVCACLRIGDAVEL